MKARMWVIMEQYLVKNYNKQYIFPQTIALISLYFSTFAAVP